MAIIKNKGWRGGVPLPVQVQNFVIDIHLCNCSNKS